FKCWDRSRPVLTPIWRSATGCALICRSGAADEIIRNLGSALICEKICVNLRETFVYLRETPPRSAENPQPALVIEIPIKYIRPQANVHPIVIRIEMRVGIPQHIKTSEDEAPKYLKIRCRIHNIPHLTFAIEHIGSIPLPYPYPRLIRPVLFGGINISPVSKFILKGIVIQPPVAVDQLQVPVVPVLLVPGDPYYLPEVSAPLMRHGLIVMPVIEGYRVVRIGIRPHLVVLHLQKQVIHSEGIVVFCSQLKSELVLPAAFPSKDVT